MKILKIIIEIMIIKNRLNYCQNCINFIRIFRVLKGTVKRIVIGTITLKKVDFLFYYTNYVKLNFNHIDI